MTDTLYAYRPLLNWEDIRIWAKDAGFLSTLSADDMHVTITYSKTPFDWSDITPENSILGIRDTDRSVQQLGDEGAVCLCFESPELSTRWTYLREQGASSDYDSLLPHCTISYQGGISRIEDVTPYSGPLIFGPEIFEPIDNNHDSKRTERQL